MRIGVILFLLLIIPSAYGQDSLLVGSAEIDAISKQTLTKMKSINNYQFILVKRELIEGEDTGYQYMHVKVLVDPLKVYIKFLKPRRYVGREVIYSGGELVVKHGGTRISNMIVHLVPTSPLAMDGNKYPITHINPSRVCKELISKIAKENQFKNTTITKKDNVKIYNQPGVHYKLVHSVEEPGMECMTAELVVSSKLGIPLYFKVVDWKDRIMEEYAFYNMEVNVKFDSEEFLESNPNYGFNKAREENSK